MLIQAYNYVMLFGLAASIPLRGYMKAVEKKRRFGLPARTWPWMIWFCVVGWAILYFLTTGEMNV